MALRFQFGLVIALFASQVYLTVAITPETCQQLAHSAKLPDSAQLCALARSLRDLGCLCGANGAALEAEEMISCFASEEDMCNVMSTSDLFKQFSIPYVSGVVKLPNLGFIQTSVLSDMPAVEQESMPTTHEELTVKPVLDLSSLENDVALDFELDTSADAELVLTQDRSTTGDDLSFNIDIGIPRTFLDSGGELDLDFDLGSNDDVDITVESDFEIDATFSMGSGIVTSDNLGSLHLEASAMENGQVTKEIVEQSLPTALQSSVSAEDAMIEMDIEISGNLQSRDAIITVTDEESDMPITGEEVGRLLTVISEWLQSSDYDGPATQRGVLRGVSKLLADVGTQVGDIMPDESLHSGQILEIYAEASESIEKRYGGPPCMLAALASAAQSITTARKSEDMVYEQSCRVCAFVNEHLSFLWCLIILCTLYVSYTLLVSFCKYLWPAQETTSLEVDDLKKPLILHAADFADASSKSANLESAVWEPYCGPVKIAAQTQR